MWKKEPYRHGLSRRGVQSTFDRPSRTSFQTVNPTYYAKKGWKYLSRNTNKLVKEGALVIVATKDHDPDFYMVRVVGRMIDPISFKAMVRVEEVFSNTPQNILLEQVRLVKEG